MKETQEASELEQNKDELEATQKKRRIVSILGVKNWKLKKIIKKKKKSNIWQVLFFSFVFFYFYIYSNGKVGK